MPYAKNIEQISPMRLNNYPARSVYVVERRYQ